MSTTAENKPASSDGAPSADVAAVATGSVKQRRGWRMYRGRWVTAQWYNKHVASHDQERIRRALTAATPKRETEEGWDRLATLMWLAALSDDDLAETWRFAQRLNSRNTDPTSAKRPV